MKVDLKELFSVHNTTELFGAAFLNVGITSKSDLVSIEIINQELIDIHPLLVGAGNVIINSDVMLAHKATNMSAELVSKSVTVPFIVLEEQGQLTIKLFKVEITLVAIDASAETIAPSIPSAGATSSPIAPVIEPLVIVPNPETIIPVIPVLEPLAEIGLPVAEPVAAPVVTG